MVRRHLFWQVILLVLWLTPLWAQRSQNILTKSTACLCKGSYQQALQLLEKAVATGGSAVLRQRLAQAYHLTGQYQQELKLLKTHLNKQDYRPWVLLGECQMTLGEYETAARSFQQALRIEPQLIRAKVDLGLYYETVGRRAKAMELFADIFDAYDPDAELNTEDLIFTGIACRYYAMKSDEVDRKDTLEVVVQEILPKAATKAAQDPLAFQAYVQMAGIFLDAYNNADAKSILAEALKINHYHPDLLVLMAQIWMQRGVRARVIPTLDRALAVNPHLVPALNLKATIHLSDEEYQQAQKFLDKSLAVNPHGLEALSIQAASYFLQNRMHAYEQECQQVLEINPHYGQLYLTVASLTTYKHKFEDGVVLCRKAVALDPFLWDGYIALGINLIRTGNEQEALKSFKKVEEEYNFHTQTHNMLILLRKLKEFKTFQTPHFRIRLHIKEAAVLLPYIKAQLEKAYDKLVHQYHFTPQGPTLTTFFPDHRDFAVNVIGLTGLGAALGVCFGKITAQNSPSARPPGFFNWGAVAWHEFAHVITLQLSNFRVPRWFTEGLSMFTEYQADPAWEEETHRMLYSAYTAGRMRGIANFNAGFTRPQYPAEVAVCYYQACLICQFITEKYGFDKIIEMLKLYRQAKRDAAVLREALDVTPQQFDKLFLAWLKKHLFAKMHVLPMISQQVKEEMIDRLEEDESDVEANIKLAIYYFQRRMYADAETRAGMALAYDPRQPDAYQILGRIMFVKKRYAKAQELLEKAVRLGCRDFHTFLYLGFIYRDYRHDLTKAVTAFSQARDSYPIYVGPNNPYQLLARIYFEQHKNKQAFEQLEAYLGYQEKDFKTRLALAKRYALLKRHADVIRLLEQAILINPFVLDIHLLLGQTYRKVKKWDLAIREYQVALALKPKSGLHRLHTVLGELYLRKGQRQQARSELEKALQIKPDYQKARDLLAEIKK